MGQNPTLTQEFNTIQPRIQQQLTTIDASIALHQATLRQLGDDRPQQSQLTLSSYHHQETIRQQIDRLIQHLHQQLQQDLTQLDRQQHQFLLLSIIGYSLALGLTGLIHHHLRQSLRQTQTLRQYSEERWQLAIESSNDGIWDHDLRTDRHFLSPRCRELVGYAAHELTTFPEWCEQIHPDDRPKAIARWQAHLNQETDHYSNEYRMRRKDGTYTWLLTRAKALYDGNRPVRAVGSISDITLRKQAEQLQRQWTQTLEIQVAERTAALAHSNQNLEEFTAIVSHDLRAPLRAIRRSIEFLYDELPPATLNPEAQTSLNFIATSAARMQQLIQGLLTYAHISHQPLILTPINSSDILADALANLSADIQYHQAKIHSDPLPTVWGDRIQLTQLFQNLISNALQFRSPASPQIDIGIHCGSWPNHPNAPGKICLFWITDNGRGIEPKKLATLFEGAQRLNRSTSADSSGMGLIICKKIIDRHQGLIWAESNLNLGTSFYFTLPATT